MSTFGENLRALRKSRGYSQEKFADVVGTNQTNISAWELETRVPNLATVRHIANVFKVPVSSLIALENSGIDDDYVREIADVMDQNPKVRQLMDKARYLSDADLDVVIGVVNAMANKA